MFRMSAGSATTRPAEIAVAAGVGTRTVCAAPPRARKACVPAREAYEIPLREIPISRPRSARRLLTSRDDERRSATGYPTQDRGVLRPGAGHLLGRVGAVDRQRAHGRIGCFVADLAPRGQPRPLSGRASGHRLVGRTCSATGAGRWHADRARGSSGSHLERPVPDDRIRRIRLHDGAHQRHPPALGSHRRRQRISSARSNRVHRRELLLLRHR